MAEVAILRRVFLLPGRESDALAWLHHTEPNRRAAGQTRQLIVRGQIDSHEYQWIQFWRSYETYDAWRRSPIRSDLNDQRGRFMTHEPTRAFDVVE